jgi:hypothetical protein
MAYQLQLLMFRLTVLLLLFLGSMTSVFRGDLPEASVISIVSAGMLLTYAIAREVGAFRQKHLNL